MKNGAEAGTELGVIRQSVISLPHKIESASSRLCTLGLRCLFKKPSLLSAGLLTDFSTRAGKCVAGIKPSTQLDVISQSSPQ